MPSNYPGISLNNEGLCNFCDSYKKTVPMGEARFLQKILSKRGKEYDCVLGISGGKDSCYVAYIAKKIFGLRVLAVSYDFPFMVDLARENSKAVCDNLGIELLVVTSRNNLEVNFLRNHLISLAATGTTWGQCLFCHYGIEAILYEKARTNEIPFILSGVTNSEVWWNPGNRISILAKRLRKLTIREKILFGLYQYRAYIRLVDQRRQFPMQGNSCYKVYKKANIPTNGPEIIQVYDYIKWDQEIIEKTLQEETGWQKPSKSLTWRYDCILEPLLDFTFKKDLGISSAGLYICDLIRSGAIDREEGLRWMEESEDQSWLNASLKTVLDYLEIPINVQDKFFNTSKG
jgi:glutamine---fructose-6-phosphate transaminase (isomerizing)